MKKLIITLVLVAGCHSTSSTVRTTTAPVVSGNETGAADASAALRGFMAAAKAQDLQAMGALWGDADGPARDRLPRSELEQRELIMMRCLRHDRFDVITDAPGVGGGRTVAVSITLGDVTRSTNFQLVRGRDNRWLVQQLDLGTLQDICIHRG